MSRAKLSAATLYAGVGPQSLVVPADWLSVTAGGTNAVSPNGVYRALRATVAGTITVDTAGGTGRVMAFAAGETRYGVFLNVSAATATGIEGGV